MTGPSFQRPCLDHASSAHRGVASTASSRARARYRCGKGPRVHIESLTLQNFQCFESPQRIELRDDLTAVIGNNGTGKTAVFRALQRLFGATSEERRVRPDDFHVPESEADLDTPVESRSLRLEAILAFPGLEADGGSVLGVPDFYSRMASDVDGVLKVRIVLEATWTANGSAEGLVDDHLLAVSTLEGDFTPEQAQTLSPAERSRIQVIYVPAARDGARQMSTFLRSRLWQAANWTTQLRDHVTEASTVLDEHFHEEDATVAAEEALSKRWAQMYGSGAHSVARLRPLTPDFEQFLRNTELVFSPDHTTPARAAELLSDGQRSLLHLSLATAALDLEEQVATAGVGVALPFDPVAAYLPVLTVLLVEEPENNLSPFYLSRIVGALLELGRTERVQVLLSSHSASALARVDPRQIRHFRRDGLGPATIRALTLPPETDIDAVYVREAVQAYPELYFARFVVLGEGASEQIVLPHVAQLLGVHLDPTFVAVVPLSGRHTQHFWRLLDDLKIPHATLLDLDYGRAGGGGGRIKTAIRNLAALGHDPLAEIDEFEDVEDIPAELEYETESMTQLLDALKQFNVLFSAPLDLDMVMLTHFASGYTALDPGQTGPTDTDPYDAVLGTGGPLSARAFWQPTDSELAKKQRTRLLWYRYLFLGRSKPETHLRAMSRIGPSDAARIPPVLHELVELVRVAVEDS